MPVVIGPSEPGAAAVPGVAGRVQDGREGGRSSIQRRRARLLRFAFFCLMLLPPVLGCVQIPRERLEIRRYALENPVIPEPPDTEYPGAAARMTALPVDAIIWPFTADAPQQGERILYCPEANRLDFYYYHRWIATPQSLLEKILAAELTEWGICGKGVHRAETGLVPNFEISGRLAALYADNRDDEEAAVLTVIVTIMRVQAWTLERESVFQKTYHVTVPRKNNRVDSFVEAANRAVEEWLVELRPDLERVFREEWRPGSSSE